MSSGLRAGDPVILDADGDWTLPDRIVVDAQGAYWADYGFGWSVGPNGEPPPAFRATYLRVRGEQTHDELHEAIHNPCTKPIHEGER